MVPEERELKLLSLVDVLEPLSREELEDLAKLCPNMRLQRGENFYNPAQHNGGLFLIEEGRIRVYLTTPTGKQVTLEMLGNGTVFWALILEAVHERNGVHVQAVEASIVAFMKRTDLNDFILKKPEVGLRIMNLLAERLGLSNERVAEIAYKDVTSRLASQILRLLDSEGIVDRDGYLLPAAYTHQELSMMVGAGRVAVSRALKALKKVGALEVERKTSRIRSIELLERIARAEE